MIRFCDKEVCCVTENQMDWQQMVDYFLDFNMSERIYVLDEGGKYVGRIDYDSLFGEYSKTAIKKEKVTLKGGKDIYITKDCVILDEKIWENGRRYFTFFPEGLLPVLNEQHELICFAWNDEEANRELRMLDELSRCKGALDFKSVFSDAECVLVNNFNELAYYLVQYLKKIAMPVNVSGEFWDKFGIWQKTEVLDYKNYVIDGERRLGIQQQQAVFRESVSADFECIDRIYEENLIRGIIKDVSGDLQYFINCLKGKKIIITEIGESALNTYDLLLGYGLDIYCFVSEDADEFGKILFGKEVKERTELIDDLDSFVFVSSQGRNSAWGGDNGEVDFYHYLGCKRNENYFLIQDYVEIPDNGFLNILSHLLEQTNKMVILAGDFLLCRRLGQVLQTRNEKAGERIAYFDILGEYQGMKKGLRCIQKAKIREDAVCLLLLPDYSSCLAETCGQYYPYRIEIKKKYLNQAILKQLLDITDYPINNAVFRENNILSISNTTDFKVKRIVIGSIEHYCGNFFFRGILDNHPQILMMEYSYISENLFSLCIRLAMEKAEDILPLLWKLNDEESKYGQHYEWLAEWEEDKRYNFNQYMSELLKQREFFSSQELFVIIHIAYAKAWGRKVENISDMVIYWEPHSIARPQMEKYAAWLGKLCTLTGYIVNMVRDDFRRKGSSLSNYGDSGWHSFHKKHIISYVLSYKCDEKREYKGWSRMIIKFENLKCNPQQELRRICNEWEIDWSDTLLETTRNGHTEFVGKVTGFDLTPVYRTYDKYFSGFDYFRIILICGPFQKQFGYSYINSLNFSRVELRDLFNKEFQFEENLEYEDDYEKARLKHEVQKLIGRRLWRVRRFWIENVRKERERYD